MHRNVLLTLLLVAFVLASTLAWAAPGVNDVAPNFRYQEITAGAEMNFYEEYQGCVVVLELFRRG